MTKYILSIDPGKSTGVALLSYDATSVPELVQAWQFDGGLSGFLEWADEHWHRGGWYHVNDEPSFTIRDPWLHLYAEDRDKWVQGGEVPVAVNLTIVGEKFTARATKGFSYRTDALEPLRIEGAMIALGLMPDYTPKERSWLDPSHQYIAGGKGKAERKKRQHALLRDTGFYRTGKDLDAPDADDFRSSCAHALSYLIRTGHKPTYNSVAGWNERNAG